MWKTDQRKTQIEIKGNVNWTVELYMKLMIIDLEKRMTRKDSSSLANSTQ